MIINQSNLSGIYKSFSTLFNESLEVTQTFWEKIAMLAPSEGSSVDYKWLGNFPMLRKWVGDRAIKDIAAFHYEITNDDFEATVEVDRNHIQDDQIGIYKPMIQELGRSSRIHPDKLVYELLSAGATATCYDGVAFFATTHKVAGANVVNYTAAGGKGLWAMLDTSKFVKPLIFQQRTLPQFVSQDQPENDSVFMRKKYRYGVDYRGNVGFGFWQLAYGSKAEISATNFALHLAAMRAFKNDEGVPLNIMPTLLVCGPSNEADARGLLKCDRNAAGATNPWFNSVELLVVPWLT